MSKGLQAYEQEDFRTAYEIFQYRFRTRSKHAAYMLANMYIRGEGVSANPTEGYAYLQVASDHSEHRATEMLELWLNETDDQTIEQVRRRADELKRLIEISPNKALDELDWRYNVERNPDDRTRISRPSVSYPVFRSGALTSFLTSFLISPEGSTSAIRHIGWSIRDFRSAVERDITNWKYEQEALPSPARVSFSFISGLSKDGVREFNRRLTDRFPRALMGDEEAQYSMAIFMQNARRTNAWEMVYVSDLNIEDPKPYFIHNDAFDEKRDLSARRIQGEIPDDLPKFVVRRENRDSVFDRWLDASKHDEDASYQTTVEQIMPRIYRHLRSRRFDDGEYIVTYNATGNVFEFRKPQYQPATSTHGYWDWQAATNGSYFHQLRYALRNPASSSWAHYLVEKGDTLMMSHRGLFLMRYGQDDDTIAQGLDYLQRAAEAGEPMAIEALTMMNVN
ncbi:SEL1-like repeat protein [Aliidiomarina indica]|uniref:SEL1-like repeat protein n=1 Tax=Aliidiomarina indica TaxID=2749147 RepID=UPI00188ED2F3|nr:SEL1-like repeat protein [Aliidiomarina indica]